MAAYISTTYLSGSAWIIAPLKHPLQQSFICFGAAGPLASHNPFRGTSGPCNITMGAAKTKPALGEQLNLGASNK